MKDQIGAQQKEHRDHDHQIAPVPAGNDLHDGRGNDDSQERQIDKHDANRPHSEGSATGQPAGKPQDKQEGQWPAALWGTSGPVRNCREQEPGDDCRCISEQHFMDMPVGGRKGPCNIMRSVQQQHPAKDRNARENGCGQEKWPKSIAE
eukprot:NODE_9681_length_509_cov_1.167539_g9658_i0.p2 GENE.NODE_9681_length_509_cov_1.167539_g9658_i0~~NODE_9681_length_509_cov_1.167539_g9658_i0.p2  ORF type:complete len:168 (+),score=12.21 NODE_9681_length_509_cov_1.167539_g9658_i0:59-505(+)